MEVYQLLSFKLYNSLFIFRILSNQFFSKIFSNEHTFLHMLNELE